MKYILSNFVLINIQNVIELKYYLILIIFNLSEINVLLLLYNIFDNSPLSENFNQEVSYNYMKFSTAYQQIPTSNFYIFKFSFEEPAGVLILHRIWSIKICLWTTESGLNRVPTFNFFHNYE